MPDAPVHRAMSGSVDIERGASAHVTDVAKSADACDGVSQHRVAIVWIYAVSCRWGLFGRWLRQSYV